MPISHPEYVRRALIAVGLVVLAVVVLVILRTIVGVLLLLFAGMLLAVFLDGLARLVSERTPISRRVALAVVLVLIVGITVLTGWLLGPKIADQVAQLADQLPESVDRVEAWLQQFGWGVALVEQVPESPAAALPDGASGVGMVQSAFSTVLGGMTNVLIILSVGIFLAINPSLYVGAVVRLVPVRSRPRAGEVMGALGSALRSWLLGRIASMAIVGVMTAVGLMVFGIPLALTLGLITAILTFIPYIGSFLAVVVAAAVAAGQGVEAVITVAVIYSVVQFVESYLITPLVQLRVVSMPPALLLTAQVVMGVLAGAIGVAVATPLTVVLVVLIQMLYIEDVLGDDVEVMGNAE